MERTPGPEAVPAIVAVDDDPDAIALIGDELTKRYGQHYRIVTERSASTALAELERMAEAGERVALVLSDQWLPDGDGCALLTQACGIHPHAKRALLISWGEWSIDATAKPLREGIALGHIDYYLLTQPAMASAHSTTGRSFLTRRRMARRSRTASGSARVR